MGYYTSYDLSFDPKGHAAEIERELKKMDVFECFDVGYAYADAKWYDYEKDMCILSAKFPDVLFTLRGVGEECEDMWYEYFLAGKFQYCHAKILFDDYSPNRLQSTEFTSMSPQQLEAQSYSYA